MATLYQFRKQLSRQRVVWFVDNSVAVSCFAKGAGRNPNIAYLVAAFHMIAMCYDVHVWFEYVQSADNWSDGISRRGFSDRLVQDMKLHTADVDWSPIKWPKAMSDLWFKARQC